MPDDEPPRTTSSPRPPRKRSPRPTVTGRKSPALAEAQRRLWQDPEHRAKMKAARQRSADARRKDPIKYSRTGVPDGMRKADAMNAWEAARAQADTFITALETKGIVAATPVPESDEEKAKACLHEVAVLALGPTGQRDMLRALRILLTYTNELPAVREAPSPHRHSAPTNHDNIQPPPPRLTC
jgi:hypothetical protein